MFPFSTHDHRRQWQTWTARYFRQAGVRVLDPYVGRGRGFDCVVIDDDAIAFVSIRVRSADVSNDVDDPNDVAHAAAMTWMREHQIDPETPRRFDILRLDWYARSSGAPVVRYFPGAISHTQYASQAHGGTSQNNVFEPSNARREVGR